MSRVTPLRLLLEPDAGETEFLLKAPIDDARMSSVQLSLSGELHYGRFQFLRHDLKRPHHIVIFMFQHVAVKNVSASISHEWNDDGKHISRVDYRRVLPSGLVCRRRARSPN